MCSVDFSSFTLYHGVWILSMNCKSNQEEIRKLLHGVWWMLIGILLSCQNFAEFAGECCRNDPEQWFFFIPMQEREARGGRPNRLTSEGYWKATGSPGFVYSSNNRIIGGKRTMVFYNGRAPNGRKTQWKMNEYKSIEGEASSSSSITVPPKVWLACQK